MSLCHNSPYRRPNSPYRRSNGDRDCCTKMRISSEILLFQVKLPHFLSKEGLEGQPTPNLYKKSAPNSLFPISESQKMLIRTFAFPKGCIKHEYINIYSSTIKDTPPIKSTSQHWSQDVSHDLARGIKCIHLTFFYTCIHRESNIRQSVPVVLVLKTDHLEHQQTSYY